MVEEMTTSDVIIGVIAGIGVIVLVGVLIWDGENGVPGRRER